MPLCVMALLYGSLRYPFCIMAICFMRLCVMPFCVMPIRVMPICVMPICVMPVCVMPLRYSSFPNGHLQNRLVAIQLWIDAFMIWTILFQILIIEFCHRYTSIVHALLLSRKFFVLFCFLLL